MSDDSLRRVLDDATDDRHFRAADGRVIRNLRELDRALDDMRDDTFTHHVNDERHDFSNWARDVFMDHRLAENMRTAKDQRTTQVIVLRRIVEALDQRVHDARVREERRDARDARSKEERSERREDRRDARERDDRRNERR